MSLSLELEFNEEAEGELTWRYEPVPENPTRVTFCKSRS